MQWAIQIHVHKNKYYNYDLVEAEHRSVDRNESCKIKSNSGSTHEESPLRALTSAYNDPARCVEARRDV